MSTRSFRTGGCLLALGLVVALGAFAQSRAEDKKESDGSNAKGGGGGEVASLAKEGYWGEADTWAAHEAMLGKPAPELKLSDWVDQEKQVKPEEMKGKIVVVDYWATWCGPCIASIPHNNEVAKHYADKGVLVIGACGSGQGEERMGDVAKKHKIEYPTARVAAESTEAWNVQWWPTYGVIDREGNLRAIGIKPDYVDKVVEALLKEQPAEKTDSAK